MQCYVLQNLIYLSTDTSEGAWSIPINRFCFADYLCPVEANKFGIEFTRFKIRDMDTEAVLFEVQKQTEGGDPNNLPANAPRFVRYQFPPEFLHLKTIGAT